MSTTRICLIRHGETAWNAERRVQGHIDIALNAKGMTQARTAADGLAGEIFAAIYCSDLARARHTAEAAARVLRLPVCVRRELRERGYGRFEALTHAEMRQRHPQDYVRFEARDPDFDFCGGESLRDFAARVLACLEALASRHAGEQILIVTHGGVLDVVYRYATGRPLTATRDFDIPNAAYNWLERARGRWSVLTWAERGHLAATLDELAG